MDQRLFERVIALCALSPLIGPGTVRRALRDVGADPATATVDDYCRAVPRLEARLRSFLPEEEAAARARNVFQLRNQVSAPPAGAPRPGGLAPAEAYPPVWLRRAASADSVPPWLRSAEPNASPETTSRPTPGSVPPDSPRERRVEVAASNERKVTG